MCGAETDIHCGNILTDTHCPFNGNLKRGLQPAVLILASVNGPSMSGSPRPGRKQPGTGESCNVGVFGLHKSGPGEKRLCALIIVPECSEESAQLPETHWTLARDRSPSQCGGHRENTRAGEKNGVSSVRASLPPTPGAGPEQEEAGREPRHGDTGAPAHLDGGAGGGGRGRRVTQDVGRPELGPTQPRTTHNPRKEARKGCVSQWRKHSEIAHYS